MMNYSKKQLNTQIILQCRGDGSELFDYNLPTPQIYKRQSEQYYTLIYYLAGYFGTKKAIEYLNDVIARFSFTLPLTGVSVKSAANDKCYELKRFQNLKSLPNKFKNYIPTTEDGRDRVFWAIKNKIEQIISEQGEGNMVAYSLIEGFAFSYFIDHAKDKSTLRAKCRSVWNWYSDREWTIPKRERKTKNKEELMATRKENAIRLNEDRKRKAKAKVINAVTGLYAEQYKKKSGAWHIVMICEATGLSPNTVKKYMKAEGFLK